MAGDVVFTGNYSGLRIYSIANPASPALVGSYSTAESVTDIVVAGDLAFLANAGDGLRIVNVSNPASPTYTGSYNTFGTAYGVAVAGNLAVVADGDYGLQIIDVTNPGLPTYVGKWADDWEFAYGLTLAGRMALVTTGSGLHAVPVLQRDVDPSRNVARSLPVDEGTNWIRRVRLSTNQTAGVSWEFSCNGANWQTIYPGSASVLAGHTQVPTCSGARRTYGREAIPPFTTCTSSGSTPTR